MYKLKAFLFTLFLSLQAFSQDKPLPNTVRPLQEATPVSNSILSRFRPLNLELDPASEARNCGTSIDLREEFARRNLPDRRHQDTTGWCYSFVGADLISYELSQNISPADIARQYLNHSTPAHLSSLETVMSNPLSQSQPLGGGFTKQALNITRPIGFCLEEEFPSEDYSWSQEQQEALLLQYPEKRDRPTVCLDTDNIVPLYTNIPIEDLLNIVTDDSFKRILNRLPHSECTERIPLHKSLEINHINREVRNQYNHPENEPFYDEIDTVLTNTRPVSISVNPDIFRPPIEGLRNLGAPNHQVLLAGRRLNGETGRCEYLIRNSESGCANYHTEYECENNHVWIPREIVRMGTFDADFISGSSRSSLRED